MDFDTAKKNIQPLWHGKQADLLEIGLNEKNKETMEMEKRQHEEAIKNYEGNDPLDPWYEYICWIEQSYPKNGKESGFDEVILNCIVHFEHETRYKQDRRMIKLSIKYIDTQKNPNELYNQLYQNGIGTLVADLYIAWSYYFDVLNDFKEVNAIFRRGFDAGAQPYQDLAQAHDAFIISISKRILNDDELSRKQFQTSLEEKRSALTSLRTHKKKYVGSIRTGNAIKKANPGVINQENVLPNVNKAVEVLDDEVLGAPSLSNNVSVIRSIIDCSKTKENEHEPGPWTKAKAGHCQKLFSKTGTLQLSFPIMDDQVARFIHDEQHENFQINLKNIYASEKMSPEELLGEKFKRGKIKILTEDDFEEIKSFIPRKSVIPNGLLAASKFEKIDPVNLPAEPQSHATVNKWVWRAN
ncbi:CLUMA_CG012642, isoform A [Clunio marinus]|uniref:CLUMA_CG012642, isoform A n=1 Tax=Clunio marinus TaxID=568069 RepID=A0A1J1IGK7_9DIPT|nr:CLUMA_CG012642, isoform A [Clunio marinus]